MFLRKAQTEFWVFVIMVVATEPKALAYLHLFGWSISENVQEDWAACFASSFHAPLATVNNLNIIYLLQNTLLSLREKFIRGNTIM